MKALIIGILVNLVSASLAFAHEGHDHAPGVVQAPHGGTVKQGKEFSVELVTSENDVTIYPLTRELTAIPVTDVKLKAMYQLPKKKMEAVTFSNHDDHFMATIDAKGAYKYSLNLSLTYQGKTQKVVFQVEKQQ